MTLAELGAKLREERVSLGLTVEDVAMRLKVPARILRAIEDGDSADLPHTVYTRGFIKGFGLILGYSSETITEMIDSLVGFSEDFSPPKTLEAQTAMDGHPISRRQGFGLVLKLLLVAVLCAGGYAYYTHNRDGSLPQLTDFVPSGTPNDAEQNQASKVKPVDTNVISPAPSSAMNAQGDSASTGAPWVPVSEVPALSAAATPTMPSSGSMSSGAMALSSSEIPSTAAGSVQSDTSVTGITTAIAATPLTSAPGAPMTPVPPASAPLSSAIPNTQRTEADPVKPSGLQTLPASSTPAGPATTTSSSATGDFATQAQLPAGMHQMVLTAEAECWVHANADGTDTRQFSLKAGETFAMPFKKSMVLKLGNAGGVKIKYDGVELPPQGASGQVKTITLPPKA